MSNIGQFLNSIVETPATHILRDDDDTWGKVPYQLKLGDTFQNRLDEFRYLTNNLEGADKEGINGKNAENLKELFGLTDDDADLKLFEKFMSKGYYQDTRVGANDALNCVWQFNRDDDILHPICVATTKGDHQIGEGRVYATTTQRNQQIIYFTFGVPYYTSLFAYYEHAINDKLVRLNQEGYTPSTEGWALGSLITEAYTLWIVLPVVPLKIIYELTHRGAYTFNVNKFYELRTRMQLYYMYVDSMLAHWLVAVGMIANKPILENNNTLKEENKSKNLDYISGILQETGSNIWDILAHKAINAGIEVKKAHTKEHYETVYKSLHGKQAEPKRYRQEKAWRTALSMSGATINVTEYQNAALNGDTSTVSAASSASLDEVYTTLNTASGFVNSDDPYQNNKNLDEVRTNYINLSNRQSEVYAAMQESSEDQSILQYELDNGDWRKFFEKSAMGATQFIGFRIDKNVDASESFSNSTSPSAFAEEFNSKVRATASSLVDKGIAGSKSGSTIIDTVFNTGMDIANGFLEGIKHVDFIGLTELASAVITGTFLDMPEQYSSSDFNKSHSVSFQLRAPYGDNMSIYQSIIIPLFCILAGALPRAGGANSYVQPFLCRVYCKGMFAIPMGIIDSVSIKRGDSEFGWNYDQIPTCIDVSISIKDMSPIMYMMMYDSAFEEILGGDSAFNEYILTLAGVGLFERVSIISRIQRGVAYTAHIIRNRYLNPMYWSHKVSQYSPIAMVGRMLGGNVWGNN